MVAGKTVGFCNFLGNVIFIYIAVIFKEDIVVFLSFAILSAVFLKTQDWEAVVLKGLEMFQY